jgi:SAM-dependent methyltransferase
MLNLINSYDDFMDSVTSVADFGCGSGMDINWWARNEYIEYTEDDNGNVFETVRPRNYKCYAVDRDLKQITPELLPDNVHLIEGNFENKLLPTKVDLIWCHNSFQYVTNPLNTLKLWNEQMVENGLLYIAMPYQTSYLNNRLVTRSHNFAYFNHNFLSMVYMLAVNGFDCRDAYFLKRRDDPWMQLAVYKTGIAPMDPAKTSWYDLAEKNLINDSMKNSLNAFGYIRQEDILYAWLDKNLYRIED